MFYTFSTSDKHSDLTGPKLTFSQTFCIQSKLRVFRLVLTWFHARELTKEPRFPLQTQTGTIYKKNVKCALFKQNRSNFFFFKTCILDPNAMNGCIIHAFLKKKFKIVHSSPFLTTVSQLFLSLYDFYRKNSR